ncbi:hypothetical protein Trydic_g18033 [Trypoxylus dichotomus]
MGKTVHPVEDFDAVEDAKALKQAFKGFGSDEEVIINIITKRSNDQRLQIAQEFKTMYGKDLIKELKSELRVEFQAKQIHKAISGLGTDEGTIVEILGVHTNEEIIAIRDEYEGLYQSSLESDLKGDSSGTVKRLFVALVTAHRDETEETDQEAAYKDAQTLLRAGELFQGTDESTFNAILCQRNRAQLRLIFDEYEKLTGHNFETAIENEFSGTAKDSLIDLVKCIRNKIDYMAERLHKSMDGMGTDDRTLIRLVVSRSEIDLEEIKIAFEEKFEKSLADFIADDTSGDYKRLVFRVYYCCISVYSCITFLIMSYPGYPYDGHAPPYPPGAPYPPGGGYPPPPNSAPYPTPGGVFPPSLGFSSQSPMYMPPPGGYPGYPPPSGGGYPYPPGSGYPPPPGSGYPPPPTGYPPPPTGGYPVYHPPPSNYPEQSEDPPEEEEPPTDESLPIYMPKHSPTVLPADPFDPVADAEILRKAMKGFGTDEKAIIQVLGNRTNEQRLQIVVQFKTLFGKDLIEDIQSESSGNFKKLLVALLTPLPILYAKHIRKALEGFGTDEEVLIEVFCTKTNHEIRTIRGAYESEFGRNLEDDLSSDTSGTFKRVMVSLCNAGRDESMLTDLDAAAEDAQKLLDAGENQWGTDESTFNMILCQRNYAQLQLIFDEYERLSGLDIEDTIKSEFSGNSENAFLAIVRSVRNTPRFFARCYHDAISGLGTKDRKLIRITATRCEIDMGDIKNEYAEKYGESLADAISGDCSGYYKKLLLSLIGEY